MMMTVVVGRTGLHNPRKVLGNEFVDNGAPPNSAFSTRGWGVEIEIIYYYRARARARAQPRRGRRVSGLGPRSGPTLPYLARSICLRIHLKLPLIIYYFTHIRPIT